MQIYSLLSILMSPNKKEAQRINKVFRSLLHIFPFTHQGQRVMTLALRHMALVNTKQQLSVHYFFFYLTFWLKKGSIFCSLHPGSPQTRGQVFLEWSSPWLGATGLTDLGLRSSPPLWLSLHHPKLIFNDTLCYVGPQGALSGCALIKRLSLLAPFWEDFIKTSDEKKKVSLKSQIWDYLNFIYPSICLSAVLWVYFHISYRWL